MFFSQTNILTYIADLSNKNNLSVIILRTKVIEEFVVEKIIYKSTKQYIFTDFIAIFSFY